MDPGDEPGSLRHLKSVGPLTAKTVVQQARLSALKRAFLIQSKSQQPAQTRKLVTPGADKPLHTLTLLAIRSDRLVQL